MLLRSRVVLEIHGARVFCTEHNRRQSQYESPQGYQLWSRPTPITPRLLGPPVIWLVSWRHLHVWSRIPGSFSFSCLEGDRPGRHAGRKLLFAWSWFFSGPSSSTFEVYYVILCIRHPVPVAMRGKESRCSTPFPSHIVVPPKFLFHPALRAYIYTYRTSSRRLPSFTKGLDGRRPTECHIGEKVHAAHRCHPG